MMGIKERFEAARTSVLSKKQSFDESRKNKKLAEIERLRALKLKQNVDKDLDAELRKLREETGKKTFTQRAGEVFDKVVKRTGEKKPVSPSRLKLFDDKPSDKKDGGLRL